MFERDIRNRLIKLFQKSNRVSIDDKSRLVIFSDLHMGNGKKRDDFLHNSGMMHTILKDFYYSKEYSLILNGDIDELLRFSQTTIKKKWKNIYRLFQDFYKKNALFKLFGNHDYQLHHHQKPSEIDIPVSESLILNHKSGDLLIFHGHQAGRMSSNFLSHVIAFILKYIATPLGITNYSVAHDSKKRYIIEKRVYDFARSRKIIAIIGHTHRPLFESLSKIDSLKFKIEHLCRKYPRSDIKAKQKLQNRIKKYRNELEELIQKREGNRSSLYQSELLVPCIFNSGCTVGRSGVTSIEICDNNIQLVYWFDEKKSRKYFDFNGYTPQRLGNTDYYRVVLNEEPLDYIFTRIKLLS
jgi:UDP-2,3-diacylglucosamine pyrophosphatase LpxH